MFANSLPIKFLQVAIFFNDNVSYLPNLLLLKKKRFSFRNETTWESSTA